MTTELPAKTSIWFKLAQTARLLFWLVLTGVLLFQVFGRRDTTQKARDNIFDQFQSERKSRVIALIHRQENQSIFGVQVSTISISRTLKLSCARFDLPLTISR